MNPSINKDLLISSMTDHIAQLNKLVKLQQETVEKYEQSLEVYKQRDLVRDKMENSIDEMIKKFGTMKQKIQEQENYINYLQNKLKEVAPELELAPQNI